MTIQRHISERLKDSFFKQKVIIILGPRQVGKTTLMRQLRDLVTVKSIWLNADEADVREDLTKAGTSTQLLQLIGADTQLVFIDEAQQIPQIGLKLKLLIDNYPHIQIVASGSSALDLADSTNEPLTGRKREFYLYPFSFLELSQSDTVLQEKRLLQTRLVYGSYPEVVNNMGNERQALLEIANSYLYKDMLRLDGIRKSALLEKLLQALALQVGSEVKYHELGQLLGGVDSATIEKYLDICEKAFIIFKLPALNRNLRNEIKKGKKYYFYDNGIRNVLISNFNSLELRQDTGALWENYLMAERMKLNQYNSFYGKSYFWRTQDQAEIDYVEDKDGLLSAFEIKWNNAKVSFPKSFLEAYPQNECKIVTNKDYDWFLGI